MRIRTKFNLALLVVFAIGFAVSALVSHRLLLANANEDIDRDANLMMETALAVRGYTIDQIKPHLDPLNATEFLPQTVPAFAAIETFERLRKTQPHYSYREAVLNPTNPRDMAQPWEVEIINGFRNGSMDPVAGERDTENGRVRYIARPIQITNPACLACHNTPIEAPESMRVKYPGMSGFGWRLEEIVGAQIVTVPVDVPLANAKRAFMAFAGVLLGLFLLLFILMNVMLSRLVIQPIRRVSALSEEISRGNLSLPEFEEVNTEEINQLHTSFNRMRRSIERAMRVLQTHSDLDKR